jgi:GT2 family glycosyltransferase
MGGVAGHVHRMLPRGTPGYFGRAAVVQNLSAVTAACLVLRRDVFEEVGGLDAENLPVAFNDIDFCLRIGERGYRVLWTPHAELYHLESATRGSDDTAERRPHFAAEIRYMLRRWPEAIRRDPYFNPNLSLLHSNPTIAFPPAVGRPWRVPGTPAQSGAEPRREAV